MNRPPPPLTPPPEFDSIVEKKNPSKRKAGGEGTNGTDASTKHHKSNGEEGKNDASATMSVVSDDGSVKIPLGTLAGPIPLKKKRPQKTAAEIEERDEERKRRNKLAAKKCRDKRKRVMSDLVDDLNAARAENEKLITQVQALTQRVAELEAAAAASQEGDKNKKDS